LISKNTITISKEVYERLKGRGLYNESYNKHIDYLINKYPHRKKLLVSKNTDLIQKGIKLPKYLTEQGVLKIVPYPSNLLKNGIISNKPLIINLLIVTKYGTLKRSTKNYKVLLKSIHNFSIKYNLRGLVNYIIDNYEALTFIDKETLKQYYETEIKIKEFEEIGNLIYSDSIEVQKI
jgi:predicted CopG family antitoxin